MAARKRQLKQHLDINARERHFVISGDSLNDFSSCIVLFISDYLNKYHFKAAHIRTPLFCLDCSENEFSDIRLRLYHKGIIVEDGMVGNFFNDRKLFRDPMVRKITRQEIEREFHVRLVSIRSQPDILNASKGDDLFFVGEKEYVGINTQDVNVERFAVSCLKEASYLIGVCNDCE